MFTLRRLSTSTLISRVPPAAIVAASPAAISARFLSDQPVRKKPIKKKKKKGGSSGDGTNSRDKQLDIVLRALDAPRAQPPAADEEEMARRYQVGRNYVIGRFERHNEAEHDLSCKLVMKRHAIKMLPRDSWLKEKALNVDYGLTRLGPNDPLIPPIEQPIPREFPPVVRRRNVKK